MEIICRLASKRSVVNYSKILLLRRTIMTSTTKKAEQALEGLQSNPYYEKYAKKIAQLQQTSPEEFLSRVEEHEKQKKPKKVEIENKIKERDYSTLLNPKKPLSTPADLPNEDLNKIMKVDLIQEKEPDEIKSIWEEYHKHKDFIAATIPKKEFEELRSKGKLYPTFLFALPRSKGYEFIMSQFYGNSVHFTPLLYYQVHKENAPECLEIVHYTEFKDSKGIVLMRGEFDKNVLNANEAQCLANQFKLYYCENNPEKIKLLDIFTNKPDEFKHMDLIQQIESLSL